MDEDEKKPPLTGLDRYNKDMLIEFCHQWIEIAEEKTARLKTLCDSGSMTRKEAKYFAGVFGNYCNLLPRPAVTSHPWLYPTTAWAESGKNGGRHSNQETSTESESSGQEG